MGNGDHAQIGDRTRRGIVAASAAISGGIGVASEIRGGVEPNAKRTAKQLAKKLANYFVFQEWITREAANRM